MHVYWAKYNSTIHKHCTSLGIEPSTFLLWPCVLLVCMRMLSHSTALLLCAVAIFGNPSLTRGSSLSEMFWTFSTFLGAGTCWSMRGRHYTSFLWANPNSSRGFIAKTWRFRKEAVFQDWLFTSVSEGRTTLKDLRTFCFAPGGLSEEIFAQRHRDHPGSWKPIGK